MGERLGNIWGNEWQIRAILVRPVYANSSQCWLCPWGSGCSPPPGFGGQRHLTKEHCMPCFRQIRGGQRTLTASVDPHLNLPSALNNLYTKVSVFGVAFLFFLLLRIFYSWGTGVKLEPQSFLPPNIQIAFTSLLVNISLAKFVLRLASIRACKHYSGCVGGDWYLSLASGGKV